MSEPADLGRFLVWVDAVGGFLVCPHEEVVIGQAAPGNRVDVPLLGDLASRHAKIRRQGEGYVVEALGEVAVAGRAVTSSALLTDGDELQLGRRVKLRFRQPHPLSRTARLEFVGHLRTQPLCDGLILLAEACILGPGWNSHVVCRAWSQPLYLYRQGVQLFCRSQLPMEIDGRGCTGRQPLSLHSHVVGADFSLSLEPA